MPRRENAGVRPTTVVARSSQGTTRKGCCGPDARVFLLWRRPFFDAPDVPQTDSQPFQSVRIITRGSYSDVHDGRFVGSVRCGGTEEQTTVMYCIHIQRCTPPRLPPAPPSSNTAVSHMPRIVRVKRTKSFVGPVLALIYAEVVLSSTRMMYHMLMRNLSECSALAFVASGRWQNLEKEAREVGWGREGSCGCYTISCVGKCCT